MSVRPPIVPTVAPHRAIMLPASFAGCGVLLLILFVALLGCASFGSSDVPNQVANPDKNAIVCSCECDPPSSAVVPPFNNFITAGADDAAQGGGAGTATLNGIQLPLGGGNTVGLRFQKLSVPPLATITSAKIQFTAAGASGTNSAVLQIFMVDAADAAAFGPPAVDLTTLPLTADHVDWAPAAWAKAGDAVGAELTEELKDLVQVIVNKPDYRLNNSVAFIIEGQGSRSARTFESNAAGKAFLTVSYLPKKNSQDFVTCVDPAVAKDQTQAAAFCAGTLQSNIHDLSTACRQANACTCTLKEKDATQFSGSCQNACPAVTAPADCNPNGIAQTTQATASNTPVCVANSPLGSMLTGRLSACDIDEGSSFVSVTVRDEDGENPHTRGNGARGRINFVGTPCPDDPLGCFVGLIHRINVDDIFFNGGIFGSDHHLVDLTGVGESTLSSFVDSTSGTGTFGPGTTKHSARGTDTDENETKGFFDTNSDVLTISAGHWQPGGACSLTGDLFSSKRLTEHSDLHGHLVNQPPTANAGADQPAVECSQTGGAAIHLAASGDDPDNNIVSFGWFKGSRTGDLLGMFPGLDLVQAVSTPGSNNQTSYVFKVFDAFGQYAEDTTSVNVVDTTPPTVTAPDNVTAECTGPTGTPVNNLGTATAADVCDASPDITSDAPQTFGLGSTTVTWTATDESDNKGTATQTVKIVDTTPPNLTVSLSPTVLWPPKHDLIQITATITVSDICDPNPFVKLISVTSNEPDNGLGDGDQPNDIQGATLNADTRSFQLRAERAGVGTGRVYTVVYEASDHSGNTTRRTATVTVPKSQ